MTVPKIATLKGMNLTELKRMAREKQLGTTDTMRGFTKDQVIELILPPVEEVDDEEDDIEPEDELDDEVEDDLTDLHDDEDLELPEDDDEEEDPIQEGLATDPAPDADEADDEAEDDEPAEKTFTAKQVATRIGTDAKTLRKFFRSPASTIEPCGQGGRYEFDAKDMPAIKKEFDSWNSTKGTRAPAKPKGEGTTRTSTRSAPTNAEVIEEDDEVLDLDDDEPSDEELLDLDSDEADDEVEDDEVDDEEED